MIGGKQETHLEGGKEGSDTRVEGRLKIVQSLRLGLELCFVDSKAALLFSSYRHVHYIFTTKYLSSLSRFPAATLSVTHSGLTTCGFVPLLDVSNLCVLLPFN
jgi:hypothetical protein